MKTHASPHTVAEERVETRPSLGFQALVARLERLESPAILDLGTASGRNVRFLSHLARRLTIADLRGSLRETPGTPVRGAASADASDGLRSTLRAWFEPLVVDWRYDVVLAWDLFDYLTPADLGALMDILRPRIRPGAILFAMISYVAKISREPNDYEIRDGSALRFHTTSTGERPSPRYKEPELLRLLGGFTVDTTFLMRHGVQEYLFVREEVRS